MRTLGFHTKRKLLNTGINITESSSSSIQFLIWVWVYPCKRGWPNLPHSNGNHSNSHSPSRLIHGILLLQTNTVALLLHLRLPCLLWSSSLPLAQMFDKISSGSLFIDTVQSRLSTKWRPKTQKWRHLKNHFEITCSRLNMILTEAEQGAPRFAVFFNCSKGHHSIQTPFPPKSTKWRSLWNHSKLA